MNTLEYIILFSIIGGILSLVGGFILLSNRKNADLLARYATPFSGGALLAAVFLDLLPEGIDVDSAETVLLATLGGILVFFIAEGFLQWFHHHHEHSDHSHDPKISLIIIGDTMHNALDGVAIAASFIISIPTGIVTTIAIATHEIPQEIGDFGLLLSKGLSRKKVLLANLLSACSTVVAAVVTYLVGRDNGLPTGVLLGFSAGFLLYIALSDIVPTIHSRNNKKDGFKLQAFLLFLVTFFVGVATNLTHDLIKDGQKPTKNDCEITSNIDCID